MTDARDAAAMGADRADRTVLAALGGVLGDVVARVVRRRAGIPSYELHLVSRAPGDVARVSWAMGLAAVRLGAALSWHTLATREDLRRYAEPGRLLYPGLAIVRPSSVGA